MESPQTPAALQPGRLLFGLLALFASAGLAVEYWSACCFSEAQAVWVPFLSLSYEANLPTWYASCLLFTCGLLLSVIARRALQKRARYNMHWVFLAAVFFYLSLDEAVGLHENLGGFFETGGILYFDWIIPAGLVVLLIFLVYLPFLVYLSPKTRNRFLIAGALYVGGALGMELPLGYWKDRFGDESFAYAFIDWTEEVLELMGVSLFLLVLWEEAGFGGRKEALA